MAHAGGTGVHHDNAGLVIRLGPARMDERHLSVLRCVRNKSLTHEGRSDRVASIRRGFHQWPNSILKETGFVVETIGFFPSS
jgi:hypothetical protein